MNRKILYHSGLLCLWITAIGTIGCRVDNDGSVKPDAEFEDGGGSGGSGGKRGDAGSVKPDAKFEDDGGSGGSGGRRTDDGSIKLDIKTKDGGRGGNGGVTANTFTGTVRDIVTDEPVPGMRVVALSNEDLSELGVETTTDASGEFSLEGILDKEICVLVVGTEGEERRIDSYHYNVSSKQEDRDFISFQFAIAEAINSMLYPSNGYSSELARIYGLGFITGSVYYKTEAGEEIPVDCATVEVAEATDDTDVFYFRAGLPDPTRVRTDTDGRLLIYWVPSGRVTLSAFVDGEKIGSVSLPIAAPKDSAEDTYRSNVVRIYADKPGDPSPDCALD